MANEQPELARATQEHVRRPQEEDVEEHGAEEENSWSAKRFEGRIGYLRSLLVILDRWQSQGKHEVPIGFVAGTHWTKRKKLSDVKDLLWSEEMKERAVTFPKVPPPTAEEYPNRQRFRDAVYEFALYWHAQGVKLDLKDTVQRARSEGRISKALSKRILEQQHKRGK